MSINMMLRRQGRNSTRCRRGFTASSSFCSSTTSALHTTGSTICRGESDRASSVAAARECNSLPLFATLKRWQRLDRFFDASFNWQLRDTVCISICKSATCLLVVTVYARAQLSDRRRVPLCLYVCPSHAGIIDSKIMTIGSCRFTTR